MKRRRIAMTAVGVAWLLAAAGCKTTGTPSMQDDMAQDEGLAPVEAQAETDPSTPTGLKPIYFDFDTWQLTDDARQTLRTNAEQLEKNPDWGKLTIEGHCDERGSDEYNLALGERRAAAVKRYLQDLGLPGARLETVSFGEDKPAVAGHDESAWRYNRRSELHSQSLQVSSW